MLMLLVACGTKLPKLEKLDADSEGAARALVERSVASHGGMAAFDALGDIHVVMTDVWSLKAAAPKRPGEGAPFDLTFNSGLRKGLMVFPNSTTEWGYDSVEAWIATDGERGYKGLAAPTFDVPTYAYFLSLPFRFLDDGLHYRNMGQREYGGTTVDEVAISFDEGLGAVQDRYVVRFDAETGRMVSTDFTVKEVSATAEATSDFPDWVDVEGVLMPATMDVRMIRPFKTPMHKVTWAEHAHVRDFDRSLYEKPDAR